MRRFYDTVAVSKVGGGFEVLLGGRPLRTPGRLPLRLPTKTLAEAVSREWAEQGAEIDISVMRLTGLANSAIDRVAVDRDAVLAEIVRYGETDLVCYRAAAPGELRRLQDRSWGPLVEWMRDRHGIELNVTDKILPAPQPDLGPARQSLSRYGDFSLSALHTITSICGSLVVALGLAEGRLDSREAWDLSQLDDSWQMERWGADPDAVARRDGHRAEMEAAAAFLAMAAGG